MRRAGLFVWVLVAGCSGSEAGVPPKTPQPPKKAQTPAKSADIAGLRTRKSGIDWPCFLGPNHNSVSPEKGILTPWPAKGPRIVWHKRLAIGYPMPTVSRGRLFMFQRDLNDALLECWNAETGEFLWKFDYPTFY